MTLDPGDSALERIISELTSAIAMTADPRLVRLQRDAIAMRSHAQATWVERFNKRSEGRRYSAP